MNNLQSFRSLQANGFGKNFEKLIDLACKYYRDEGKADISKIDEPFRELLMVVGLFVLRQSTLGQTG